MGGQGSGPRLRYSRALVESALVHGHGSPSAAARILGCDPSTVWRYLHRYARLERLAVAAWDLKVTPRKHRKPRRPVKKK